MRKLFVLVVLGLFMCGGAKGTIAGDICGYVYDTNDKGLPGVEISTKDDAMAYSEGTSSSGHYYLSLGAGTYTVKYAKKGYQTQTDEVSVLKNEKRYLEMVIMVSSPTTILP